jgi:hypothetical protein
VSISPVRSLTSSPDQTCSALCYILEKQQSQTHFPISAHGSFFPMIPSRLGGNIALDFSVECLCSMYTDSLRGVSAPSKTSLQLYAQSLSSLRQTVLMPQKRAESETICASIIMQLCEVSTQALPQLSASTHFSPN